MKKFLLALAMLLLSAPHRLSAAEEWIDVTSLYVTNPSYANNNGSGWVRTGSCGSFGAVNYGCMEFWNGWFNVSQQLSGLPRGHYRVQVQAYYRSGDFDVVYPEYADGTEEVAARLYAGSGDSRSLVPICSVFDESFQPEWRWGNDWWSADGEQYYPNQMSSASDCFAQDKYWNELEFDVDGDVTIGLECLEARNSNWCIFTNWRLQYWGDASATVLATGLSVQLDRPSLQQGDHAQATVSFTPANTTTQRVEWHSTDVMVATVGADGAVIARNPGEAEIVATAIDGSGVTASAVVTVTARPGESDDREWVDVTDIYLRTPRFEGNDASGWTTQGGGNPAVQYECLEYWNASWFDMSQQLSQLPRGHYRLSVNAFHRYGSPTADYSNYVGNLPTSLAYLYAGDARRPLSDYMSSWFDADYHDANPYNPDTFSSNDYWDLDGTWYFPNTMWSSANAFREGKYLTQLEFDAEGDVSVGIALDEYSPENWFICSNFRLEFIGEVIEATGVSAVFTANGTNRIEVKAGQSVQCEARIEPSGAMVKSVTWESATPSVATVDQSGLVTAVGVGSSVIRAVVTKPDGTTLTGRCKITVVRDALQQGDLLFNEVMAANTDEYLSPAFNFDGWAELYNATSADVGLTGFYLSDDAAQPMKWRLPVESGVVPAHGHQLLWFDSHDIAPGNAPFKLDVDGGTLILSDDAGRQIAIVTYPSATARTSYARTADGGTTWGTTATPTPGATNATASFAQQQLADPVVDQPSQFFTGELCVNVGIPSGCTLRYTLDGTLPTLQHGETSQGGQFRFSQTTSLRVRLFAPGMLPSAVATRSYLLRERDYQLPVVSVVTDPDFLYSSEIGLFAYGPHGRPGNGQSALCNFNMNWQRPVNFSYLTAQGDMALNQDVSLEVSGGWSRAWNPRAFKLKGDKAVGGQKQLPYPFFDEKPYIRNRTLQIRNGGNDNQCRFFDPSLQYILQTAHLDIDLQSYQPVHEFINGEYIGVMNMREPNNKHYVYANYGWDDEEIDQFEMSPDSGYVQKCGTPEAFDRLVDLSSDAALDETYAEVCRLLDIDAYANYMAAEMYLGNWDWPQNNVKGFRHRDGGRFRFVVFDLDGSLSTHDGKVGQSVPFYSFEAKEQYQFDQLYPTTLGRITAPIRFVTLFRNLLRNDQFRRRFITAYAMMGGSVYEAQRAAAIVDQLAAAVEPAMQLDGSSVYPTANNVKNGLRTRLRYSTDRLMEYAPMQLEGLTPQRVQLSSDVAGAQLFVDDMAVPTDRFDGYLFAPARLRAAAPAGYAFQGWKDASGGTVLVGRGATWSYYDQGALDGQLWYGSGYGSARSWPQAPAPFGYGKDGIATEVNQSRYWGENHPTVYFRTTFSLDQAPQAADECRLDITVDDGAIVYVNGKEAARYNMPDGTATYSTWAASYAPGNPDQAVLTISPTLLRRGSNTIAVELHNNAENSTDLYWDARLVLTRADGAADYVSTDAEISLPEASVALVASFRQLTDDEKAAQGVTPVRINEVSGSNDSYVNEYDKKADWVELYNTTDHDIDVEGMYLSDDASQPQKCQLTRGATHASTIVPAHGHLVVWCDKQPTTDRALHASFKISGEGGQVVLTAADRSWHDVLAYPLHDATATVGRYPDGCADVYTLSAPTIGHSNLLTSYAVKSEQGQPGHDGLAAVAAANGLRICYASGQLLLHADEARSAVVDLYATDGRLVARHEVRFTGGAARLSVAHLPAGFYVARATDDAATRVGCKFMR